MKDIFLSHAWGNDEFGRDNHKRCKEIADKLQTVGYTVWFDAYDMYGNIDSAIMKGINNCKIVIICLTNKYCNKINNCSLNQLTNDNCYKEWNYSLFKQKIIIPILMEPSMIDTFLTNDGIVQMYLNSMMFIDFSHNIIDDFNILCKTLKHNGVYSSEEKKYYTLPSNSFNQFLHNVSSTIKSLSPRTKDKVRRNINRNILRSTIKHKKFSITGYFLSKKKSKKLNVTNTFSNKTNVIVNI